MFLASALLASWAYADHAPVAEPEPCVTGYACSCVTGYAYHNGAMVNGDAPANNAEECLAECNKLDTCHYWDWDFDGPYCRLRSDTGPKILPDFNAIAGPKNCVMPGTEDCREREFPGLTDQQLGIHTNAIDPIPPALLNKLDTPVVVYYGNAAAKCGWNCIVYGDSGDSLLHNGERPVFRSPGWNDRDREVCRMYCVTALNPEGRVGKLAESSYEVIEAWGAFDVFERYPQLVVCGEDLECIKGVVETSRYSPSVVGYYVYMEIKLEMPHDGWNSEGLMKWDPVLGKATPCTANCARFSDTTGYSYKKQYEPSDVIKCLKKGKCPWMPLLETDGWGAFMRQQHVTPHIGLTVKPQLLESFPTMKSPNYKYRSEMKEVTERLKATTEDRLKKDLIEFFDDKEWVVEFLIRWVHDDLKFPISELNWWKLGISMAEHDAVVLAWREKVKHDLVRPTTLIQNDKKRRKLDTYGGNFYDEVSQEIDAKDFEAFYRVMAHSEFPSGSQCQCTAYAEFMNMYSLKEFGRKMQPWTWGKDGYTPETMTNIESSYTFDSPSEFANMCGRSRLWAGLHFSDSVGASKRLCKGIGAAAYEKIKELRNGSDFAATDGPAVCE